MKNGTTSLFSNRKELRKVLVGLGFISPWIAGFLLLMVYPLGMSLYYSFTKFSLFGHPTWIGISNYLHVFRDGNFYLAAENTGLFALMAIPSSIVFAMGLAFVLNNKMPGTSAYRSLIFVPAVIPAVSTAVIWYWILSPKWGLLNGFLATLNITGPPWLTDPAWAKPSLLIMTLWMIGSDMVLYLAGLQDVPAELYEAADLEGAGSWTKMSRVSIPLISRIVFFHFINAMIWASQYFDVPYIVSGQAHGSPNPAMANSLFFYVIYLYQSAFTYLRMGYASALSWILFVVVLGFSVVIVRTSKSWVYYEQQ